MFQKPTVADLRRAAQKLGMNPSDAYLNAVEQIITPLANAYATLDTTPDDLPAVKYPRGQFYRPSAEENPHGAWYMKTSIKGKPGGKLAGRRVAQGQCLPCWRADDGRRPASGRLCAGDRCDSGRADPEVAAIVTKFEDELNIRGPARKEGYYDPRSTSRIR